jgi:hypothetical protein
MLPSVDSCAEWPSSASASLYAARTPNSKSRWLTTLSQASHSATRAPGTTWRTRSRDSSGRPLCSEAGSLPLPAALGETRYRASIGRDACVTLPSASMTRSMGSWACWAARSTAAMAWSPLGMSSVLDSLSKVRELADSRMPSRMRKSSLTVSLYAITIVERERVARAPSSVSAGASRPERGRSPPTEE